MIITLHVGMIIHQRIDCLQTKPRNYPVRTASEAAISRPHTESHAYKVDTPPNFQSSALHRRALSPRNESAYLRMRIKLVQNRTTTQ